MCTFKKVDYMLDEEVRSIKKMRNLLTPLCFLQQVENPS